VDISHGKRTHMAIAQTNRSVFQQRATSESQSVGPRSLNICIRKKENDRIERENHEFAKRLF